MLPGLGTGKCSISLLEWFSKWTIDGVSSGIDTWVTDGFFEGGAGALFFLPKELMDVTDPEDIVDKLVSSRITLSKLLWFKLDMDIDLDGKSEWFVLQKNRIFKNWAISGNTSQFFKTYTWLRDDTDLEGWTWGGPGGGGALRFLVDLGGPAPEAAVNVLMAAGEVGRSPGEAQPDPELMLLSPALWNMISHKNW